MAVETFGRVEDVVVDRGLKELLGQPAGDEPADPSDFGASVLDLISAHDYGDLGDPMLLDFPTPKPQPARRHLGY